MGISAVDTLVAYSSKAVNIFPEARNFIDNTKWRHLLMNQGMDFIRIKSQSYLDSLVVSLSETQERINNNGDIITRNEPRDVSAMPFTYVFEAPKVEECVRLLNSFYDYCNSVGAIAIFAFPSIPIPQYKNNQLQIEELYIYLTQKLKMAIISNAEDVVYDPELFEDTVYHLNPMGRKLRTASILDSYMKEFQDAK